MTLQQLKYALALQRYGSFGKAAGVLNISQPALSLQMRKLEEELGVVLFDRSVNPVETTELGEQFLEKAQELLSSATALQVFAAELEADISGELTIGIIPTLAPYFVPLFAGPLAKAYPGIQLIIKEATTEQIVAELKASELNAGILATPYDTTGIVFQPLFYEKFLLYVSPSHPLFSQERIAVPEVPKDQLLLLNEGNCFRDQVNNICQQGKPKNAATLVYRSNSIESLRRIVDYRGGLTFIPELATLGVPADQEEMIKELKGPERVREISLALSRTHTKRRLIDRVIEIALQNIPQHMLKKGENQTKVEFSVA